MPGKRNRKSKILPPGARAGFLLDDASSFSGDLIDRVSGLSIAGDDDDASLFSSSSRQTADDVLLQSGPEAASTLIHLLDTYLEQLSEKSSKSRSQMRISVLKQLLHALQKDCSTDELTLEWNSGVTALVEVLARIVRQNVKDEEAILASHAMSVLSVQVCDPGRVTQWLTSDGWQEMLLTKIRDSAATSPSVRSAAIHTLATLHFTSDYENFEDLLQCMRIVEKIYHNVFTSGQKSQCRAEHQMLQRAAVENWALLFCFLPLGLAETEGRSRLSLMQMLLHHPDVDSRLRMSAGQCLALICERLRGRDPTGVNTVPFLIGSDKCQHMVEVRDAFTQLMLRLKALANVSDKSLSKDLKRDMRACFRSVLESIDQDLGSAFGGQDRENRPLTVDEYDLEVTVDSDGDDEVAEEEDGEEWLSKTPSAQPRWQDGRNRVLKLGVVKLPLTRETIWLQRWSHKRFYDSLSDTLKGALPQHLQFNQMVRQMFDLGDAPALRPHQQFSSATAFASCHNIGATTGHDDARPSKQHRRRIMESDRKDSQLRRHKERQMREQRLGRQASYSEEQ